MQVQGIYMLADGWMKLTPTPRTGQSWQPQEARQTRHRRQQLQPLTTESSRDERWEMEDGRWRIEGKIKEERLNVADGNGKWKLESGIWIWRWKLKGETKEILGWSKTMEDDDRWKRWKRWKWKHKRGERKSRCRNWNIEPRPQRQRQKLTPYLIWHAYKSHFSLLCFYTSKRNEILFD